MKIHFINKPINLRSNCIFDGCNKVLTGTIRLDNFTKEDGVFVCDLTQLGITPSKMRSRGFYTHAYGGGHSELFIGDRPCSVSRYPKAGSWLYISDYKTQTLDALCSEVGNLEDGFFYTDDTPKAWKESADIWIQGYWAYDWANSFEQIDVWDKETGYIKACPPYGLYGYQKGQRFCFLNVKEEIKPGVYAIDYQNNLLYFLPFEDGALQDVRLSVTKSPCFEFINQENIVIKNCVINGFVGDAIHIKNCRNIRFENCTIYNIGGRATFVEDSEDICFEHCEIFHIDETGIDIKCGDRKTLTPSNSGIKNCLIHDCGAWCKTFSPAINLNGVGLYAKGNTVFDCPHNGIFYYGNEIKITDNVIYNVLLETQDAGAIYSGRDYTCRGNEVSDNLICLVKGKLGFGTMGIYNDDCMSGTIMERNVFYKVQRAVFLGGGVDFVVKNNVFIACEPALNWDLRGTFDTPQWRRVMRILKERFYGIENGVNGASELYLSRYPELQKIHEAFQQSEGLPFIPSSGVAIGNIYFGKGVESEWNLTQKDFETFYVVQDNKTVSTESELQDSITPFQYEKFLKAKAIELKLFIPNIKYL